MPITILNYNSKTFLYVHFVIHIVRIDCMQNYWIIYNVAVQKTGFGYTTRMRKSLDLYLFTWGLANCDPVSYAILLQK